MAGDWIKMRANLQTHPKVVRISSALKADRLRTVGGLHAVWCLFDEHSEDGCLCGYTPDAVDELIGWPGFTQQLIAVGWVEWDGQDGLELPEFDTHNGASAKRRAMEADRKRAERAAAKDGGNASASDADKKRTREEKRREERNTPEDELFESFWSAYPRKVGKDAARKAFSKRKVDEVLLAAMVAAVKAQGLAAKCAKGESQFVPHASTWLNEGRWQDEVGAPVDDDPYDLRRAL